MKRPLFLLLIGLVLGELCACFIHWTGVVIPASLLLLLWYIRQRKPKQKPFFIFMLPVCLAMIMGIFSWNLEWNQVQNTEQLIENMRQKECQLEGRLVKKKKSAGGYTTLTMDEISILTEDGEIPFSGKMSLTGSLQEERFYPSDELVLTAELSRLESARNPGAFDEKIYALSNGIYARGYYSIVERKEGARWSYMRLADQWKTVMEENFMEGFYPEDAALLSAMAFGDRSYLSPQQKELFEENGVAHLLAVSGLHVSIVGGRIYRTLRKKGISYGLACVAGAILLLFYGCMTGFGSSVFRAVCMFLVFLLAEYLGTPYDLLSSISMSGILILLEYPYRIMQSGFLISYASVLAIGIVLPVCKKIVNMDGKHKTWILPFFASFVIYLSTCPIMMRFFYECTPYCILLNPIVLPCMGPLMLSALVTGVFSLFFGHGQIQPWIILPKEVYHFLWKIFSLPAVLILRAYQWIFHCFRRLPGAVLRTGCPSLWKILLFYSMGGLILYCFYWRKRRCGILLFIMMAGVLLLAKDHSLRMTMLDVGQGDCMLLRMPSGETMLIDGGSTTDAHIYEDVIEPALAYYGISALDYALITHLDEDHISGVRQMIEAGFPVRYLLTGDEKEDLEKEGESSGIIYDLAFEHGVKIVSMKRGDSFSSGQLHMTCLHPQNDVDYMEENDKSLVLAMKYGSFCGLFTGDLGMEYEPEIAKAYKEMCRRDGGEEVLTILKVAHHGSKYSSGEDFLKTMRPQYSLISAGAGNRYGHPHTELLERLESAGSKIYATLEQGAICLRSDGKKNRITYWREERIVP